MNINGKKTKEILIGQVKRNAPPLLTLGGTDVERVTTFKLLGVHISDDLKWAWHVDALASKVASRIYFLKQLKRSGASTEDLICFLPQLFDQYWNTPAPYGILTSQLDNLICWNHCKSVH